MSEPHSQSADEYRIHALAEIHSRWGQKEVTKENTRAMIEEAYDAGRRAMERPPKEIDVVKVLVERETPEPYTRAEVDARLKAVADDLESAAFHANCPYWKAEGVRRFLS